jgi:hypothetical protein
MTYLASGYILYKNFFFSLVRVARFSKVPGATNVALHYYRISVYFYNTTRCVSQKTVAYTESTQNVCSGATYFKELTHFFGIYLGCCSHGQPRTQLPLARVEASEEKP